MMNADELKPQSMWNADLGNGRFQNPILYADYSDPDAIRVGDDYFMIASSFCNAPALPVLHSKDLVNWKVVNYVCDRIPVARYAHPVHGCGVWAPAIRYHEGIFYVCFPMPDEGIYMSTTKDPFGEWSKPVNIRPGAGWIDPCPFWDEDGRAYLVAGVARSRIGYKSVLHMVEMQPDGMGLIGEEVRIFDGNLNDQVTIEGPKMYKRNGYYYIFAPAGGVKVGWQTVLRSKNVFGPYEYKVVMRQGDSAVNGPHQGAWVDTQTGQDWFIHFQDVYAAGRITHLQPMSWENDWPMIGIAKNGNDYGEPVMEYEKPDIGEAARAKLQEAFGEKTVFEPATSDEFEGDELGMQWQWSANYESGWYGFSGTGEERHLHLSAVSKSEDRKLSDVKSLLLQKWPAPEFSCVTKMDMSNLMKGDMAGIVSLGMHYAGIGVLRESGKYTFKVIEGTQHFDKERAIAEQHEEIIHTVGKTELLNAAGKAMVWFLYKVERTGTKELNAEEKNVPVEKITMSYSLNGTDFVEAISFEAVAGRWVGVKNGVFCTHDKAPMASTNKGFASVYYVKYFR